MTDQPRQFAVAIGLAGAAGSLEGGLHTNIPALVEHHSRLGLGTERSPTEIGLIMSALTLLSLVATIGILLAGYWWTRRVDIPAAYGRFAVSLFGAAIIGLGVGLLTMFHLLSDQPWLTTIGLFGVFAVSSISVPIPGLAGGAIAQYRSVTDTP